MPGASTGQDGGSSAGVWLPRSADLEAALRRRQTPCHWRQVADGFALNNARLTRKPESLDPKIGRQPCDGNPAPLILGAQPEFRHATTFAGGKSAAARSRVIFALFLHLIRVGPRFTARFLQATLDVTKRPDRPIHVKQIRLKLPLAAGVHNEPGIASSRVHRNRLSATGAFGGKSGVAKSRVILALLVALFRVCPSVYGAFMVVRSAPPVP